MRQGSEGTSPGYGYGRRRGNGRLASRTDYQAVFVLPHFMPPSHPGCHVAPTSRRSGEVDLGVEEVGGAKELAALESAWGGHRVCRREQVADSAKAVAAAASHPHFPLLPRLKPLLSSLTEAESSPTKPMFGVMDSRRRRQWRAVVLSPERGRRWRHSRGSEGWHQPLLYGRNVCCPIFASASARRHPLVYRSPFAPPRCSSLSLFVLTLTNSNDV